MPKRFCRPALALTSALFLSPISWQWAGAQSPEDRRAANLAEIERSRALIAEYYELQKQIDVAEASAQKESQILRSRIELLQFEIDDLTKRTKEQETDITETDKEREKLLEEDSFLDAAEETQIETVEEFERRIRELLPALPEPLLSKVSDLVERMPTPDKKRDEIQASPNSRFAVALNILDQISRFDSDVTVVPETRELSDGRKVEVQNLYLGLAKAFYAGSGNTAEVAGIGLPDSEGWSWEERPEEAEAIGRAIRQYSREEPAAFVGLPVKLEASQP